MIVKKRQRSVQVAASRLRAYDWRALLRMRADSAVRRAQQDRALLDAFAFIPLARKGYEAFPPAPSVYGIAAIDGGTITITKTGPAIEAANVFHHGDTLVFHPDGTVTKKTPEAKVPEECQCCGGILAEDGTCPQCASQGCTACVKCGKDADMCECGMKEPS